MYSEGTTTFLWFHIYLVFWNLDFWSRNWLSVRCPVNAENLQSHLRPHDAPFQEVGTLKIPAELPGGRKKQSLWKINNNQALICQNGTLIYEKCYGRTVIPGDRTETGQNPTIPAEIQQEQRNKAAHPLMWFLWMNLSPTVAYRQKCMYKNRKLLESTAHLDRIREVLPEH